jgi:hypothetical protein
MHWSEKQAKSNGGIILAEAIEPDDRMLGDAKRFTDMVTLIVERTRETVLVESIEESELCWFAPVS